MSKLKISSNLFLGSPELKKFQNFLDEEGFRKNIIQNSSGFGLIRSDNDLLFENGLVTQDSDTTLNGVVYKTIQHKELNAIDQDGLYIYKEETKNIIVPTEEEWYWVRISHKYSNEEKGTWSLNADGQLSGTGGNLTEIFRGSPNFPTKIVFLNSELNTLEYEVNRVIDDNNAILSGLTFQNEENLKLAIVGTFTYGASINPDNKLIFNNDSCLLELIKEDLNAINSRPTIGYQDGKTFYICRLKVSNNQVIIQDKRNDYWETKGSFENKEIDILQNPLIGVEAIKFCHPFSAGDKNIIELAWSFRSQNWTINSSTNTVTISSGFGGKFKSVNDFTDGDFNGWRFYAPNGKWSKIVSSVKQGNAINCKLDTLDVDNFSIDGGETFIFGSYINIAPNAEEIELIFTPNPGDNVTTLIQRFLLPINTLLSNCEILVFKDPSCTYQISYRYKSFKTYSAERFIPSDEIGYYDENSFDSEGNILPILQTNRVPYTQNLTEGFITLQLNPNAYKNFVFKVDKGDLLGIQKITNLTDITNIELKVGVSLNHVLFLGNITLTDNVLIQISNENQVNGNNFKLQFNCDNIDLGGFNIILSAASNGGGGLPLKTLTKADFYQMKNIDGGIIIDCYCDGNTWNFSQNYDLGRPFEFIEIDGVINNLFDSTTGLGKVKGLFGYVVCNDDRIIDGVNVPNLSDRFMIGSSSEKLPGTTGGSDSVTLVMPNIPKHRHAPGNGGTFAIWENNEAEAGSGSSGYEVNATNHPEFTDYQGGDVNGNTVPFDITPKYYSVIKAKKIF